MTEETIQKAGAPEETELAEINRYTRRAFSQEELYAFSVVLCDNDLDRDGERFTTPALHKLSTLFLGKTGIFNHSMDAATQSARIFSCKAEELPERRNIDGEPYCRLVARAYLPRSEKNADFILELESGMKKEVSVGCAVKASTCSVCAAKSGSCSHKKGVQYSGKTCHTLLSEPTDAYEWSFVAVPAQREAGVIKGFAQGEDAALQKEAALGRLYRAELEHRVTRLCLLAQPGLSGEVAARMSAAMEADDLRALEKAFSETAAQALPLVSQLAPTVRQGDKICNDSYKI